MPTWDEIARALEHYLTLVFGEPRVRKEFEASRPDFFVHPSASSTAGAELRHLEWFLLERPSAALGAVPAVAWRDEWLDSYAGGSAALVTTLLQSLPGAFEVTAAVDGEGLWVRDLFTQGELPVTEPRAARGIEVGDLLVGRLYPSDGGAYLLSFAMVVFRSPVLLAAIRTDLAAMRAARRGVLRIQQLELEHLFHGVERVTAPPPSAAEVRGTARRGLLALGLKGARVESILRRLERAAQEGDGGAVTELLNGLAFDTPVDLPAARILLVELWDGERSAHSRAADASPTPDVGEDAGEDGGDPLTALEAFDRGRAEGKDLELLFRELERDLGLEGEGDDDDEPADEDDAGAPDFPGVVGAMVDEFLWDVEREEGEARTQALAGLRKLGEYGQDIGVFEELDRIRLLDFSARWMLDESGVTDPNAVAAVLAALESFCVWVEEHHQHPLQEQFGPTLRTLHESVPRLVQFRAHLAGEVKGARVHRVVALEPGSLRLRDEKGNEVSLAVTADQEQCLRAGDLVQVGSGPKRLGRAYPGELGDLLE
jgi:hypothetical protein